MKKIILGCAAVLLSLGLLAGCNNKKDEPPIEEAVVITVDSAASVVVGESLALTYTVSPAKAEVVAASDNQDIVTAVAQEGTLYLEGVAEGSAIVTLVGTYEGYASANKNINVSVITKEEEDTEPGVPETGGEDETTVKLTIENTLSLTLPKQGEEAEPVKIEYTVDPTEEEGTEVKMTSEEDESIIKLQNLADGWYVTPVAAGSATISVTAEYTSEEGVEYTPDGATIAVTVTEEGEEEPEPEPESLTYTITIGSLGTAPEGTVLYAAGDFNGTWNEQGWYDWGEEIELEDNENATYNLVLDFLPENGRSFEILATNEEYDNDETGSDLWDHVLGSYTITGITDDSNGTTIAITISTEYDCWEDSDEGENPVFKALGEDETIYVVFLDSTGGTDHTIVTQGDMNVGTYTVVDNKGNATFGASNESSCTPTMTTTNQSRVAFYTEEVTVPANASVEFDLYVTNNSVTYHETSPDLEVPEAEEDKINVLVLGPWFEGWLSDTPSDGAVWWGCNFSSTSGYENSGLGWLTMDESAQISEFVASISYTYPW